MLYGVVVGLVMAQPAFVGIVHVTGYTDRAECEKIIPGLRSKLHTRVGQYIVLQQGCKTRLEWVRILGTDPFPGEDT